MEGIFRVSARVSDVDNLRAAYRRTTGQGNVELDRWQDLHVHACALKQWLRDLPYPLFSYELYDAFKWALGTRNSGLRGFIRFILFFLFPLCLCHRIR